MALGLEDLLLQKVIVEVGVTLSQKGSAPNITLDVQLTFV